MPKLGIFSGNEVCEILMQHGFVRVRQRGSHIVMQKSTDTGTITVPVPNHRTLCIGTLNSIIRQSQLNKELFIR